LPSQENGYERQCIFLTQPPGNKKLSNKKRAVRDGHFGLSLTARAPIWGIQFRVKKTKTGNEKKPLESYLPLPVLCYE
jgi:hypothetical protein